MSKLRNLSGHKVVSILTRDFGFKKKRQKGSHVVLVKISDDRKIVAVVPLHKKLKVGTVLGILSQAGIPKKEFEKKI
ncbi:MAG: type II toxin-antitoxin system HicA family toxin [Candidatus Asgardarchaeia archaeon]